MLPKNLLFDNIIFSLQKQGGGSRYWYEILSRAAFDNFNFKDLNYFNAHSNLLFKEYLKSRHSNEDLVQLKKRCLERFRSPESPFGKNKFVFHSSYYRVSDSNFASNVLTIHDFIPELYYSGLRKLYNKCRKSISISNCSSIICVSNSTRNDLLNFFPLVNPNKVFVIHNGVSNSFFYMGKPRANFILYVGARHAYKNFFWAVKAVSILKDIDLYIVGSKLTNIELAFISKYKHLQYKVFTDIDNEELNLLYNRAFALLYPSDYEGFGLPVVEAMRTGCPVIAQNKSSISEISPSSDLLLESLDIDEFLYKFNKLKSSYSFFQNLGINSSSKFTWEASYEGHKKIYNYIL